MSYCTAFLTLVILSSVTGNVSYKDRAVKEGVTYNDGLHCLFNKFVNESDPLVLGNLRNIFLHIEDEVTLRANFTNLVAANLSTTHINELRMQGITAILADITIPILTLTADKYDLFADVHLFEINGSGKCLIYLRDINFAVNITIRLGSTITIQSVSTHLALGSAETHLENLMEDPDASDFMNQILSDMLPDVIVLAYDLITSKLNELIKDIANDMLSSMTIQDLLDMIAGACDE